MTPAAGTWSEGEGFAQSRFVMFPRPPELEIARRATVTLVTSWFETLKEATARAR